MYSFTEVNKAKYKIPFIQQREYIQLPRVLIYFVLILVFFNSRVFPLVLDANVTCFRWTDGHWTRQVYGQVWPRE